MKKVVISLGGSLIIPDKIDYGFLKRFKETIRRISKNNKIVIVTGGGKISREYMRVLEKEGLNEGAVGWGGVMIVRANGYLVKTFLGIKGDMPRNINDVKRTLRKSNLVVAVGTFGFIKRGTTDGEAALIAKEIKADYFVNMTNVSGLHDKNPLKYKDARFIRKISFKDFMKIVNKIKYKPGQHFVLDQAAAGVISRYGIKTYIIGRNLKNLENLMKGKRFRGSEIS